MALLLDFPGGVASWFSLVPMPRSLSVAVAGGAAIDFVLCYQWESFLRLRVHSPAFAPPFGPCFQCCLLTSCCLLARKL